MAKSSLHTHIHENNSESLSHLESNEKKFSDQCFLILNLLNQGVRLTVKIAIEKYGIASLPRRIADLEERNGIKNIKNEWIKDGNGKRLYKEWFIDRPAPPTKKEVIEKHSAQIEDKRKQATLRDGTVLKMGDEVECTLYPQCNGEIFIVCEMNPWPHCESGVLVVAYLKSDPERKIKGFKKDGVDLGPDGIDAHHYKLIK